MPDFSSLTERQREIYDFIRNKIEGRGYGPTVREIGLGFDIKSPNGVMCHLKALEKKGLRLLYLTPWPPTGIWSKAPLKTPSDLSSLSIRTYDKVSSEVFASVGAKATPISFADTMPRLVDGSINAVLSSGDGGTGRKLWEYLPYFSEITYSLPLSVASVNRALYDGLSQDLREAVDAAGRQTESELWLALSTRLQENYQRMRQNGITIDSSPAPAIVAALQSGAAVAQRVWCTRSGPVCIQILDAFKAGKT